MNIKLLFHFSLVILLFCIFDKSAFAQEVNYGHFTTPSVVDGSTYAIKLTVTGLAQGETYRIMNSNGGAGSVLVEGKPDSNGTLTTGDVCATGDGSSYSQFTLKSNCNPDKDYFHEGETYRVDVRKKSNVIENVYVPTFVVAPFRPLLIISPTNPTPNDEITLKLLGRRRPTNDDSKNTYYLEVKKTSNDEIIQTFCLISGESGTTKNIGRLAEGQYTVGIHNTESNNSDCKQGGLLGAYSISVTATGGGKVDISPKLVSPTSPITTKITTLNFIVVSNLHPLWWYKIKLGGKWNGEVSLNGEKKFQADANGQLAVGDICDNGEAGRGLNSGEPCEDVYNPGVYTIEIVQEDGLSVGIFSFSILPPIVDPLAPGSIAPPKDTVNTGLGILKTKPEDLVSTILTIAIGIAGGIAFLLIVYGGFRMAFSQGDPKAVQEARDIITSAIVGLILIVFSVFLLNLIGVDILGLPIGD